MAKALRSFSGDHGMMPPVSLLLWPQTLLKMSFQAKACGTATSVNAPAKTKALIIEFS